MSVDYLIITPPGYEFGTFFERFPSTVKVYDLEDGRYNIQGIKTDSEIRNAWIDTWDHVSGGFRTINDVFNKEQIRTLNTIKNHKFFCLTAGNKAILNTIVSMIANDPNVLIENEAIEGTFIPGDKFVARLQLEGKITFSEEELLSVRCKDFFIITPPDYEFETLLSRIPSEILVTDNEYNGTKYGFYIEAEDDIWHAWIDTWDNVSCGFQTIDDAFEEEQMRRIDTITTPKFFCITARNNSIINTVLSIVADDPNVLICDGTQDENYPCQIVSGPIIPGDEFVACIRQGKMIE